MDNKYEIINGIKLKKCKKNEIRNPVTLKCDKVKIESNLSNYKEVLGIKECPPDKIYNKETKRCVLKSGAIGKKILASLIQKRLKYSPLKEKELKNPKEKEEKELKKPKEKEEKELKKLKEKEEKELKKLKEKELKKLKEKEEKELKKLKEKELKKLKEKQEKELKKPKEKEEKELKKPKEKEEKKLKKLKEKELKKLKEKELKKPKEKEEKELKKLKKDKKQINEDTAAKIIQNKMKGYLLPFLNRVTANIYDRIVYYKKIIKNLNFDKNRKNYCVKFYKFDKITGKPIFRIGNNIILKKEIGSGSTHGAIYLSSFRDKTYKLLKYVVKISPISYKTPVEIKNNEIVSNAVIKNLCPHFPISYGYGLCMKNNLRKSSFIPSLETDNIYKKEKIPKFVLSDKDYYVYLNELASGDLRSFNLDFKLNKDKKLVDNKIAQIFISLIFFYKETGCYHCDAHDGNFLYHKIKEGGYYHYNIFNNDYYLPNLGYLWIIWDYEHAKTLTEPISNHKVNLKMGYDFICIMPYLLSCCNTVDTTIIRNRLFTPLPTSLFNKVYDKKLFHTFIISILECLCDLGYIYRSLRTIRTITPNEIINKKPYIIDDISPMK